MGHRQTEARTNELGPVGKRDSEASLRGTTTETQRNRDRDRGRDSNGRGETQPHGKTERMQEGKRPEYGGQR
eukprot:9327611-Alexandrium_andersonii.AAC.1